MKITSFFLVLIFLAAGVAYSQSNKARRISETMEDGSHGMVNATTYQVPFVSDLVDPEGTITNLTTFADYVTNGNNIKKLAVLGDTIIATGDYLDSNWASLSERRIRYNVSFDGGVTWSTQILVVNLTDNQAYGDLNPVILTGARSVAISGRQYFPGSRAFAATDILLGLGVFTNTMNPAPGQDFFAWVRNSTELAGAYRSGDTIRFAKYNYVTNLFSANTTVAVPPTETDANARYTCAVASNGQNIFIIWWVSTANDVKMVGKESTDGGATFGSITTLIPYPFITPNGDSVSSWFGLHAIYKPGTTTKMAAFNTLYPGNFATRRGSKLMFWSPGINGGNPVVIADWRDTAIHYLNDSLIFENATGEIQVGVTPVSHPSLAYTDDGSRLICFYSVQQPDTSSYGYFFNDIFVSYSNDNGATWSAPRNVTNTPNVDEIYPSVSPTGNLPSNAGVVFQVSDCPGSSSFTNTTTPRCPVYWVYRRYDPVTGNQLPIGVKSVSNEIPNTYSLHQNFPNPFNPSTKIRFSLPKNDYVTLRIYDAVGREIRTIVKNEYVTAGVKEVTFDASNLASGVYFYRIEASDFSKTKKMMLIK